MDASKYIRYACGNCSTSFTPKAATGRPSIYCSIECRPANRAKKPAPTNCKHCNGVIESQRRGKIYCSTTCAVRSRDGSKQTRQEYLEAKRENALANSSSAFNCLECGIRAFRKLGGASKAKGYSNKYCGRDCQLAFNSRIRAEIAVIRKWADRPPVRSKLPQLKALVRTLARLAVYKSRAEIKCICCGGAVGYGNGAPRKYCSKACIRKSPAFVNAKRAAKYRRKALSRGCTDAKAINPIKVLERDGWRCQICLRNTPQKLRGTLHKRAPEVDHRVPISKGGAHTWDNLQCACRECNGLKGNSSSAGQLGLFS